MLSHLTKRRPPTSGNRKGRTNVRPFRRSVLTVYFLNGRLESSRFFSDSFFFSGALGVEGFLSPDLLQPVLVGGTVGGVGTVPPPAATPKSETEAKRRAVARSEVFMTQPPYAHVRGLKTPILYQLSKVTLSPSRDRAGERRKVALA